mgnify:CR=1 FL=1
MKYFNRMIFLADATIVEKINKFFQLKPGSFSFNLMPLDFNFKYLFAFSKEELEFEDFSLDFGTTLSFPLYLADFPISEFFLDKNFIVDNNLLNKFSKILLDNLSLRPFKGVQDILDFISKKGNKLIKIDLEKSHQDKLRQELILSLGSTKESLNLKEKKLCNKQLLEIKLQEKNFKNPLLHSKKFVKKELQDLFLYRRQLFEKQLQEKQLLEKFLQKKNLKANA